MRFDTRAAAINNLGRVEMTEHRIDDRPAAVSGDMQQRLQIAGNLVTGPRLVLMDKPTGGFDPANGATALEKICDAKARGAAIVTLFQDHVARFTRGLAA